MDTDDLQTVTPSDTPTRVGGRNRARMQTWPIGARIEDRYRVVDVLGGPGITGMGVVYILEENGTLLAAKTFQYQYARDLNLIERFLREARTWLLAGFHPHIVHAYYADIIDATPMLFMEYIERDGEGLLSLADWIKRGPIAVDDALEFAIHCCDGMAHANAAVPGLVHRDLKPENLLIGRGRRLKITDFGLVRKSLAEEPLEAPLSLMNDPGDGITVAGTMLGTPAYMAPEQFISADEVTERSDIYAFGCTFYEAICGERLFANDGVPRESHMLHMRQQHLDASPIPLRLRAPVCPPRLSEIIMRCLRKDPGERWPSFAALGEALRSARHSISGSVTPPAREEEATAERVAQQVRSLTLLDGYGRAVRHRHLRESHDLGPYAFHLALASYFRVQAEQAEEGRQLEKAMSAKGSQAGHEAARRLAEHYLRDNEIDRAGEVVDTFLAAQPSAADHLLEPRIAILLARGETAAVEAELAKLPEGFRRFILTVRFYRATDRRAELAELLRGFLVELLGRLGKHIAALQPSDTAGWDRSEDRKILRDVLKDLAPEIDCTPLGNCYHAAWPRLDGYPDFAADVAFLSQTCGELAQLGEILPAAELALMQHAADKLDYPRRLQDYLQRDERWIWLR